MKSDEQVQKLLDVIKKIQSKTTKLLKDLKTNNPGMQISLLKFIRALFHRSMIKIPS